MAEAVRPGERDLVAIEAHTMRTLTERDWQPNYFVLRRRSDLQTPTADDALVAFTAARLGTTRLIDNLDIDDSVRQE